MPNRYEFKAIYKDGTEFPGELSVGSIRFKGRKARQGVIRDITERVQAEKALRESEEKYKILTEESPLGLTLISEEGNYKYLNPKFVIHIISLLAGF